MNEHPFLFVCCQAGGEATVKQEIAANHPGFRFAFSRPGFLTFKAIDSDPSLRFQLKSVFARTNGWSLGPIKLADAGAIRQEVAPLLKGLRFHQLHAWHRSLRVEPGEKQPVLDDATSERARWLLDHLMGNRQLPQGSSVNSGANAGNRVVDLIQLDEGQWWLGWHHATSFQQRWPGGRPRVHLPEKLVSRAYLKLTEALMWSDLPIAPGDRCVEIGSAPGGACQALLERKQVVVGIDPAEMDAVVMNHENFTHLRKRAADVRRAEYAGFKWLFCDANVVPNEMLRTIEEIVNHDRTSIQGLVLTLKLGGWKDAQSLKAYVDRVRGWGYKFTRLRQLATNHHEVCLVAMRSRGMRRRKKRKSE